MFLQQLLRHLDLGDQQALQMVVAWSNHDDLVVIAPGQDLSRVRTRSFTPCSSSNSSVA
jgi:hypothetical protein